MSDLGSADLHRIFEGGHPISRGRWSDLASSKVEEAANWFALFDWEREYDPVCANLSVEVDLSDDDFEALQGEGEDSPDTYPYDVTNFRLELTADTEANCLRLPVLLWREGHSPVPVDSEADALRIKEQLAVEAATAIHAALRELGRRRETSSSTWRRATRTTS